MLLCPFSSSKLPPRIQQVRNFLFTYERPFRRRNLTREVPKGETEAEVNAGKELGITKVEAEAGSGMTMDDPPEPRHDGGVTKNFGR